jgi:DNA-binding MarR family transcriptional regulator
MKSEFQNVDISGLMNDVLKSVILLNKEIESHFGMSSARTLTLLAFTEKETMRMSELSEAMSLTTSTSTRMIDSLVREGIVERGYDKFDRRLVTVELTGNGKKIARDIKAFRDRYFDSIKDKVKYNGKEEMISSLKTLIDAFGSFKSQLQC